MRHSDKLMLHDYVSRHERLRRPDHRAVLIAYMRGLVALGIIFLASWFMWHISGGIVTRLI